MKHLTRLLAALAVACAMAAPASAVSLIRDAEIERTLARIYTPVFRAAGLPPESVSLLMLNNPELNAFVFGGRNMVLHTGLMIRLETPEALAAVIAHEAGHITGGHLLRRQLTAEALQGPLAIGAALAILAGAAAGSPDVAVAGVLGSQSAAQRAFLAYSRGEESSADQAGASYLESIGVDPAAMLEVLKIFRGQEVFQAGRVDPYALTHPLSSARMQFLADRAERSGVKGGRLPEETHYWHKRMRAKLSAFLASPRRTLADLEREPNPDNEFNLMRRAIALHLAPDPDAALAAADKLIALRPDDPYYWELKGQILFESGRGREAVAPYRKAVALAPDEPLIRGGLGRALLSIEDPALNDEALRTLEEATRTDPGEPAVLRDLALAYARAGEEGKAALATAERYALRGDLREAYRHAGRALDMLPVGSPGWLKADDIRAIAERTLQAN